jgi:hypothetical protein
MIILIMQIVLGILIGLPIGLGIICICSYVAVNSWCFLCDLIDYIMGGR